MFSTRRFVAVLACACTVGLMAAGCANSATSAAQVGGVDISESAIFDRTSALVSQGQAEGATTLDQSSLAQVNRVQTTSAIRSRLLEVAAQDKGVDVTDEQVNAALAGGTGSDAATQLGTPDTMVEQTVRDLLVLEGLVSVQPAAGAPVTNVTTRIDGVSVPSRDAAVAARSQFLADPAAVDSVIAASAAPVEPQTVSVLQDPTLSPTGVFNAQPGEVILYPGTNGYYVVRILDRTVAPAVLTAADLTPQELSGKFDLGSLLLVPYAESAGVTVNPRLGVWDPLTLQVVPGGSGL